MAYQRLLLCPFPFRILFQMVDIVPVHVEFPHEDDRLLIVESLELFGLRVMRDQGQFRPV